MELTKEEKDFILEQLKKFTICIADENAVEVTSIVREINRKFSEAK